MRMMIRTAADLAAEAQATVKTRLTNAIDAHIEARVRALGYNSAAHLATYVGSTVEAWAAEAKAFIAWRDACWLAAFDYQADVLAGNAPPTEEAAIAALPLWHI